jgi:hypothetical protein
MKYLHHQCCLALTSLLSSSTLLGFSQLPSVANGDSGSTIVVNDVPDLSHDEQPVLKVSQLSDVHPTDWAFGALRSLVEKYGCIAGLRDQKFHGNRALTRYEFAAGLDACLSHINQMISVQAINQADLAVLDRLQQDFLTELAILRNHVDDLEAKAQKIQTAQFSTTTKLYGDVLVQVADVFGRDVEPVNNTTLQSRARLTLDTSFTGRDRLRLRLQSANFRPFTQPGREVNFGYAFNTNGELQLGVLNYQFPVGDRSLVALYANGDTFEEITLFNPANPFDLNAGRGAISRFAYLPPIYRTANTNAGIGMNVNLSKHLSFAAGYLGGEPANPAPGGGLFNGNYGTIARLLATNLFGNLDLAVAHVHSYTGTTATTSGLSFLSGSRTAAIAVGRPTVANSYGLGANWKLSPKVQLGGWVGATEVRAIGLGDATVWNYAVTLALADFGGRGNLAGLIVGMEPRLTNASPNLGTALGRRQDPDVGLHLEAFYRMSVNQNIDITPGIIWLTAPNHDRQNADIFAGVLRTTLRF